jgi:hypothetical protein
LVAEAQDQSLWPEQKARDSLSLLWLSLRFELIEQFVDCSSNLISDLVFGCHFLKG